MAAITTAVIGAGAAVYSAKQNSKSASKAAEGAQFNPYNVNTGNVGATFGNGTASGSLGYNQSMIQQALQSGANGFLSGLPDLQKNGGINQFLTDSFNQYNNSAPNQGFDGVNSSTSNVDPSLQGIQAQQQGLNTQGPNSWFGNQQALQGLAFGAGNLANQYQSGAANPQQLASPLGGQFNSSASGFLGSLGSFDPNQAASDYTNQLRATAMPQEQRATSSALTNLFNTGRLGTTGGSQLFADLDQSQQQADIQRQLAGKQYAGQEQSRLAGMAQGLGAQGLNSDLSTAGLNDQLSNNALGRYGSAMGLAQGADQFGYNRGLQQNELDYGRAQQGYNQNLALNDMGFQRAMGLNDTNYNRSMTMNDMLYNRSTQSAQQRFQNAMSLFGGGQQNLQSNLGAGLGLLSGSQSIDQQIMNAIQQGGSLGGAQSAGGQAAAGIALPGQIAQNNLYGQLAGQFASGLTGFFRPTPGFNPSAGTGPY